jgi:hypothetical protein
LRKYVSYLDLHQHIIVWFCLVAQTRQQRF